MTMQRCARRVVITLLVLTLLSMLFIGCADTQPIDVEPLVIWAQPTSAVPVAVAIGEGYLEAQGINIDLRVTQEDEPPFLAGHSQISLQSAWDVAQYRIEGEDIMLFGTGGGVRFFNGIAVRADSAYSSVTDLIGHKLGNPGFGTGTWLAFEGLSKHIWEIDARNDFENVTASPGALLGLLEKGEIEGALLFSGQTISAQATGFRLVFNFSDTWEEFAGQPLLVSAWIGHTSWLRDNTEVMQRLNTAVDQGVLWMIEHPEAFGVGRKYEQYASQAGWLQDAETARLIQEWIKQGLYYITSDVYTQEWINSSQEFNEVIFGEETPPKKDVFWPVTDLSGK